MNVSARAPQGHKAAAATVATCAFPKPFFAGLAAAAPGETSAAPSAAHCTRLRDCGGATAAILRWARLQETRAQARPAGLTTIIAGIAVPLWVTTSLGVLGEAAR